MKNKYFHRSCLIYQADRCSINRATTIVLIAALAFFAACGGSSSSPVTPAQVPTAVDGIDGKADVAANSYFVKDFEQAVNTSTITTTTFFLQVSLGADDTCDSSRAIAATIECTSTVQCKLYPTSELTAGTAYILCIAGAKYATGQTIPEEQHSFTTAASAVTAITATLLPVNEAVSQTLDVAVTSVFSDAITEPSDWTTAFTLKKDNTGSTVCTSVTYDSSTKTATCAHANLSVSSSYTAAVSGITNVTDASVTFTTGAGITVSSFSKASLTSTSRGTATLTFNLSSAASASATASLAVTTTDTGVGSSSCSFSSDRTVVTCTIATVSGCTTLMDYSVALTASGVIDYSAAFNSADDEFDNSATRSACWTPYDSNIGTSTKTYEITGGNLKLEITAIAGGAGDIAIGEYKSNFSGDFAMSVYLASENPADSGNLTTMTYIELVKSGTYNGANNATGGIIMDGWANMLFWALGIANGGVTISAGVPNSNAGDLQTAISPIYFCISRYDGKLKYYGSADGATYTQLSANNMDSIGGFPPPVAAGDTIDPAWNWTTSDIWLDIVNNKEGYTYTVEYGYMRFNATGLDGSSSDCPAF